jgi:hypothetical protein
MPEVDCKRVEREEEENRLAGYIYYASKIEELSKEVQRTGLWMAGKSDAPQARECSLRSGWPP